MSVLAAVDLTPDAQAVLAQAARMAASRGTDLTVLHVVEERVVFDLGGALGVPVEVEAVAAAHTALTAVAPDGARIEVIAGRPVPEVLLAAAGVELVVLGVGSAATGVGVVASAVARRADVPVLLVQGAHDGPFRRVLACVDFSPTSARAADEAAAVARADGASLCLLHAWTPPSELPTFEAYPVTVAHDDSTRRQLAEALETEAARLARGGLEPVTVLEHGLHHADAIGATAMALDVDLIAMGKRGRGSVSEILLGTTAERLLRRVSSSVWIAPPRAA